MEYAVFRICLTYTIKDYNLLWYNDMRGEMNLPRFRKGLLEG